MKIPVKINNEEKMLDIHPSDSLLAVLRKQKIFSPKCGCLEGSCGSCTVLLDGKAVPSCIVPAALARDSEIETLEHFAKSELYADIVKGFSKAGITLCGYCNAGKFFLASQILSSSAKPSRKTIVDLASTLAPCCVNTNMLADGILYAFEFKLARIGEKKNAR